MAPPARRSPIQALRSSASEALIEAGTVVASRLVTRLSTLPTRRVPRAHELRQGEGADPGARSPRFPRWAPGHLRPRRRGRARRSWRTSSTAATTSTTQGLHGLVDERRGPRRGRRGGRRGPLLMSSKFLIMVRRSASSAPRLAPRGPRSSVTSALRLPRRVAAFCTTSSSCRSDTRLMTPSIEVVTLPSGGGDARDHRVRLGVAVERRGRGVGDLDELDLERLRQQAAGREAGAQALFDLQAERLDRGAGRVGGVLGDADAARGDGERGAERRLRVAVRVDDRRVQRVDVADLQAAEADRRAGLQAADRTLEEGVDHDALAGVVVEEVLPRGALGRVEVEDVVGGRRWCPTRRCRRRRRPEEARPGCRH